jgi:hypothetical protein
MRSVLRCQHSTMSSSSSYTGLGNDRFSTVHNATTLLGTLMRLSSGVSTVVLRQLISFTNPATGSRLPRMCSSTKSSSRNGCSMLSAMPLKKSASRLRSARPATMPMAPVAASTGATASSHTWLSSTATPMIATTTASTCCSRRGKRTPARRGSRRSHSSTSAARIRNHSATTQVSVATIWCSRVESAASAGHQAMPGATPVHHRQAASSATGSHSRASTGLVEPVALSDAAAVAPGGVCVLVLIGR